MASKKLVMIADDEPDILETAKQLLQVFGYPSVTVDDAKKIVETVRKNKPALLLQDVVMPNLDVPKLVQELRSSPETKALPVILFSAYVNIKEVCKKSGADGYIMKPFDLPELKALLAKYAGP
ncbi:MAG: response regulator [Candidatus Diapherotrites archaeon]|uniref:Response regulator n=1 Tax=Candidatus Iainarchaeum sp. TaxID=3101447 RepID=A0A8T4L7J7_9ARCH|nr:response regulator [Candidatus Diapherotrites archaeon]